MRSTNTRVGCLNTVKGFITLLLASVFVIACSTNDGEITDGAVTFNAEGESSDPQLGAAFEELVNVRVISDVDSILTGSTETAQITAYITTNANVPTAPTIIDVAADGGLLQNIAFESDLNGEAGATLELTRDFRNRDISVEVTANGSSDRAVIRATGTEISLTGRLTVVVF